MYRRALYADYSISVTSQNAPAELTLRFMRVWPVWVLESRVEAGVPQVGTEAVLIAFDKPADPPPAEVRGENRCCSYKQHNLKLGKPQILCVGVLLIAVYNISWHSNVFQFQAQHSPSSSGAA